MVAIWSQSWSEHLDAVHRWIMRGVIHPAYFLGRSQFGREPVIALVRPIRVRRTLVAVGAAVVLVGCTGTSSSSDDGAARTSSIPDDGAGRTSAPDDDAGQQPPTKQVLDLDYPPNVAVSDGGQNLRLTPYTVCWSNSTGGMCSDGSPPNPLPTLGRVSSPILLRFPASGWKFSASQRQVGADAKRLRMQVRAVDDTTWELGSNGPPGRYDVKLFGRGPQGDVSVAFTMATMAGPR